jgi:hypothetical protein
MTLSLENRKKVQYMPLFSEEPVGNIPPTEADQSYSAMMDNIAMAAIT